MADYLFSVPFFLAKEGGLSRASSDTASQNPLPVLINQKQVGTLIKVLHGQLLNQIVL